MLRFGGTSLMLIHTVGMRQHDVKKKNIMRIVQIFSACIIWIVNRRIG